MHMQAKLIQEHSRAKVCSNILQFHVTFFYIFTEYFTVSRKILQNILQFHVKYSTRL